jgi:uncharacterized protein
MTECGKIAGSGKTPLVRPSFQTKYAHLKRIISRAGSAVVAFSGGVDSAFLLKVCHDVLKKNVLAVTAKSETLPVRELEAARDLAEKMMAEHIVIVTEELKLPGFSDNPPNRCYMCKTELFSKVKRIAEKRNINRIFDGCNADDKSDFRPGRIAAREMGIRSPLEEAGLTKAEIRSLSKMLNLPTWDKPSFACLSSRFPYHSKITIETLRQVENAENYLWNLGMRVFRVRHHDTIARLELGKKEMQFLRESGLRNQIVQYFKSIGYKYIALDLEGYRTGSMNETLTRLKESKHMHPKQWKKICSN